MSSRLIKTRAIALRHQPFSETSRVVRWITQDHGILTTMIKGALRPRSQHLGQVDMLYTCELVYYGHERDRLLITREVCPVKTRSALRRDWRAALAGLYFGEVVARAAPHHEPDRHLFDLLDDWLDELHERGWHAPSFFMQELSLLDWAGLTPVLDRCASCRQPFNHDARPPRFSVRSGGLVCARCENDPATQSIGLDVLAMLKHWQASTGWSAARAARCSPAQHHAIAALLGSFVHYHLDVSHERRANLLRLVQNENATKNQLVRGGCAA